MRRALACALAAALASSGCITVHKDTRVEKGPVLRAYEREVPAEGGGVAASVDAKWPKLTLSFHRFDMCRKERVEEVVEERITESSAPSAGPSFAMGVVGTTIGGGLLAFRGKFSDEPNTRYIDQTGHYGPPPRQVATVWSAVLLGVGVPALVTGIIGLTQNRDTTETAKVEQVASSFETQCHPTPADGQVELVRASGEGPETLTLATANGKVTLTAAQLQEFRMASVQMNGELVLLPEEDAQKLGAFLSCNDALPVPSAAGLARLPEQDVVDRYNVARQCEPVGGAIAERAVKAYSEEIQRRRMGAPGPELPYGPVPQSEAEALRMYPPALRFTGGSPDLPKLKDAAALRGQAAVFEGVVRERSAERLLLDVAGTPVEALIPAAAPFSPPEPGARVYAIGVIVGQDAGSADRPLTFRAVWVRESL